MDKIKYLKSRIIFFTNLEKFREKDVVLFLILIGSLIKVLLICVNFFFSLFAESRQDAQNFHNLAVILSTENIFDHLKEIGWYYSVFLSLIYKISFSSIIIGSLFSVIAWILSAYILYLTLNELKTNKFKIYIALGIYTFLPSIIFYSSLTLRESYQLLFLNLAVYSFVKIENKNYLFFIGIFISIIFQFFLHEAMFVSSLFILFFCILSLFKKNKNLFLLIILISFFVGIILNKKFFFIEFYPYLENFQSRQYNHLAQGTSYLTKMQINNFYDLIIFLLVLLFKYFFYPLPHQINSLLDFICFIENFLRLFLLYYFLKKIVFNIKNNYTLINIFIIFFITEIIWSTGIASWGTAIRHHMPQFGILLIIAFSKINIKNLRLLENEK